MAGWTCSDRETNRWEGTLEANRFRGDGAQLTGIAGGGDVTAGANLTNETLVQGDGGAKGIKTTTVTAGEVAANTAKDTNVTTNITVVEAPTNVEIQSSDGTNDTIAAADVTNAGVMTTTMYDEHVVNTAHAIDNTQAHTDYLINNGNDTTTGNLTVAALIAGASGIETTDGGNIVSTGIITQAGDNSTADQAYVPMVLYNTDATPPAASGFPIGTLYVQYTA